MSIFEAVPKCEVCQVNPVIQKPDAIYSRCASCKDRFDQHGEPFIVYCRILSFDPGGKKIRLISQADLLHFWMMPIDPSHPREHVVKCPEYFSGFKWKTVAALIQGMEEMDYYLTEDNAI